MDEPRQHSAVGRLRRRLSECRASFVWTLHGGRDDGSDPLRCIAKVAIGEVGVASGGPVSPVPSKRLTNGGADSLPRTISGSDHDRALVHAAASAPAPAQRLGERPVVLGQVRHSPAELCDLLLQGFDLLLQGLDLRGVLLLRLLVLRGQRPQGGVAVA